MQKWEYMTIYRAGGYIGKVSYINEQVAGKNTFFGGWKGDDFYTLLNKLGQQGWEVTGLSGHEGGFYVVLKRPIGN